MVKHLAVEAAARYRDVLHEVATSGPLHERLRRITEAVRGKRRRNEPGSWPYL